LLALAETMQTEGYRILAFDNFRNVDQRERAMFAQALEVLSDRASETGDVEMVVIGIADDADTLVGGSGSVRRRTTEIGVPRMPDDEIANIFISGFRLLGLEVEENALRNLVFYCDGFPYFAHLLGLAVARDAARSGDGFVSQPVLEAALVRVALGELVKPTRGSILARTGKPKHYVFRFSDPYLRPFLRMKHF